ncbi:hypothetical protein J31TS3_51430 [Paenibacillus lactis]|nr:hypothetical protein J31TS3_51430 [Paenibacillus lactis]
MSVLAAFLVVPVVPTVLAAQAVLGVLAVLVALAAAKMPYNFTPSWDSCCHARLARVCKRQWPPLGYRPSASLHPYRQQIHSLVCTILYEW